MKQSFIFCLTLLMACSEAPRDNHNNYVVSSFNKPKDANTPPPPPMPVYAATNFIVDTAGRFFYYQLQIGKPSCFVEDDLIAPPYIGLKPQHLIEIPAADIANFIVHNQTYWDSWGSDYKYLLIASTTDTITAPAFELLLDLMKDTANHLKYSIRKTTQEENVVLSYKKKHMYYFPNAVKWDSSKINFLPAYN